MKYKEIIKDLFTVDDDYYLAHCISSDCALGAGIAVEFNTRFKLRAKLLKYPEEVREYPMCIRIGRVFNLITKELSFHKPTMGSLETTLWCMREIANLRGITKIAMPIIGCGRDKLKWEEVRLAIQKVFKDTDIEILICMEEQ